MINVILYWSPEFEVGRAHGLDHLVNRTGFPILPVVGQMINIACYDMKDGAEPEESIDYIQFVVKSVDCYLEGPNKPVDIVVTLELRSNNGMKDNEFESLACEVLMKVYKWQKED